MYVQTYNGCVYYYRIDISSDLPGAVWLRLFCCHGNGCSGLNMCKVSLSYVLYSITCFLARMCNYCLWPWQLC